MRIHQTTYLNEIYLLLANDLPQVPHLGWKPTYEVKMNLGTCFGSQTMERNLQYMDTRVAESFCPRAWFIGEYNQRVPAPAK